MSLIHPNQGIHMKHTNANNALLVVPSQSLNIPNICACSTALKLRNIQRLHGVSGNIRRLISVTLGAFQRKILAL